MSSPTHLPPRGAPANPARTDTEAVDHSPGPRLDPADRELVDSFKNRFATLRNDDAPSHEIKSLRKECIAAAKASKDNLAVHHVLFRLAGEMGRVVVARKQAAPNYQADGSQRKFVGKGAMSRVYASIFTHADKGGLDAAFKKDVSKADYNAHFPFSGAAAGIDKRNKKPETSRRERATYKVAKMLGTDIIPKAVFADEAGEKGTATAKLTGKTAKALGRQATLEIYRKSPDIRRDLSTLQLLDAITGEVDRHHGNVFICEEPTRTGDTQYRAYGIDNALSFGYREKGATRRSAFSHNVGFPQFVDRAVAQTLSKLTPDDLRETLGGLISPLELGAAVARLQAVQAHVRDKATLVDDWQSVSVDDFVHKPSDPRKVDGKEVPPKNYFY